MLMAHCGYLRKKVSTCVLAGDAPHKVYPARSRLRKHPRHCLKSDDFRSDRSTGGSRPFKSSYASKTSLGHLHYLHCVWLFSRKTPVSFARTSTECHVIFFFT